MKVRDLDEWAWKEWVATRPESVQKLCRALPPDRLYKLKNGGHRVTLYSYGENGTVTVDVTGEYNFLAFGRRVFGIKSEDLTECDLPGPEEHLGAVLTEEADVMEYCDTLRERMKE